MLDCSVVNLIKLEFPSIYDSELELAKRRSCVRSEDQKWNSGHDSLKVLLWSVTDRHRCSQCFPACPHFSSTCRALLLDLGLCCTRAGPRLTTRHLKAAATQRQQLPIDFIHRKLLPQGLTPAAEHTWLLRYPCNLQLVLLHQRFKKICLQHISQTLQISFWTIISSGPSIISLGLIHPINPLSEHPPTGSLLPWLIPERYRKFCMEIKRYHSIKSTICGIAFEMAASRGWKGN